MAREGTRSQTGSATPRVFHAVDTAPSIVRKKAAKPAAAKPTGVTKKKAPKKELGPVAKVSGWLAVGGPCCLRSLLNPTCRSRPPPKRKRSSTKLPSRSTR